MADDKLIAGGGGGKGGGGGSQHSPVESADSLRSIQYARVLDAVSEGEIQGFVNGVKSVFLDDVPLQNEDFSDNFQGVAVALQTGTQGQSYIPGYAAVESEVAVGVQVTQVTPIVRTITNANVNAVRVTIGVPRLTYLDTASGDLSGSEVVMYVDVQTDGGGYSVEAWIPIQGKTTTRYQRSYRINLNGSGPWDIRVRRATPDSSESNLSNDTYWDSYAEIIDAKLGYPNTAFVALQVDASQFSAIPRRAYDLYGIKVKIPSNYTPSTRAYSGEWDGTFQVAWTDNPAWIFYDLVTESRYGLGRYIAEADVDKWQLYSIAQYCDELVDDGFGGQEPRFTCNLYLQTQEEAYTVLTHLASAFRGVVFWADAQLTCVQDAPSDPVALIAPANVLGGVINYEGSARLARHTVALVTWNDPADRYLQAVEYVEDIDGINRYGYNQTAVVAVGCASRGQAHRLGKAILYAEANEIETAAFRTGISGTVLYPGAVHLIADPTRAGARMGGRVLSASGTTIVLDASVQIESGETYALSCELPDGTVESRGVTTGVGTTATLTIASAFSANPQQYAVWILSASNLDPTIWRVVSVTETESTQYDVVSVSHDPNKYAAIESNVILEPLQSSLISTKTQAAPASVTLSDAIYIAGDGTIRTRLTVAWEAVRTADHFLVEIKAGMNDWHMVSANATGQIYEQDAYDGVTYLARVTAVSPLGVLSLPKTSAIYKVLGKSAPPPDVDVFTVAGQADGTRQFAWSIAEPPVDLAGSRIRYRLGTGYTWDQLYALHTGTLQSSPYESNQLAAGDYTFAIKAVDTSGNESANALFITGELGDPRLSGVIASYYEYEDGWPGTKTDCHVDDVGLLQANESAAAPWTRTWSGTWILTPESPIVYERNFDIGTIAAFTPLVSVDADGSVTIQEAHSNDGSTYSSYATAGAIVTARYIKIKVTITGSVPLARQMVTHLSATPKIEVFSDLDTSTLTGSYRIAAGDIRLPITKSYAVITQARIVLQNVGAGWTWTLIDKTTTYGPRIKIYNGSGTLADATIDAEVIGL